MKNDSVIYIIIRFLWIIVLLPKELQFVFFLSVAGWWMISNKKMFPINRVTIWFILYACVHFLSITVAIITREYELTRIFAAFNTCFIWVIAMAVLGITMDAENIDYEKIGRACRDNIIILLVVFFAFWNSHFAFFNGLETRNAWVWDLLSSGETTRFCGFFEYPTLVSSFTLVQFPWAFIYTLKSRHKWSVFPLTVLCFLPILFSKSRVGIVLYLVVAFFSINRFILSCGISKKALIKIYAVIMVCMCIIGIVFFPRLLDLADKFANIRPGSNSSRMVIYMRTLEKIEEVSWLFGAGVKEMIGVYPLGSHCTYLGILFKSGIVGSIFWVAGVYQIVISLKRNAGVILEKIDYYYICLSNMMLFFLFMLEDIDGANWLLIVVMLLSVGMLLHVSMPDKRRAE